MQELGIDLDLGEEVKKSRDQCSKLDSKWLEEDLNCLLEWIPDITLQAVVLECHFRRLQTPGYFVLGQTSQEEFSSEQGLVIHVQLDTSNALKLLHIK